MDNSEHIAQPSKMKKTTNKSPTAALPPELTPAETAIYHLARAGMLHEPDAVKYGPSVADLKARGIIALAANGNYLAVSEFDPRVLRRDTRQKSIKVSLPAKVEPEEKAAVEAFAAQENINVSEAVRRLIRAYLMGGVEAAPTKRRPHKRRQSAN